LKGQVIVLTLCTDLNTIFSGYNEMRESKHIELNKIKWDKWAESADGKGVIYEYLRRSQLSVISLLDIKKDMSFLDIGCGTGWAVGQVAKAVDYKGTFYGIDLSSGMIGKARENFMGHDNIHFVEASSESIPLADNQFDNIICTNSFHHYLHPEKAMKEIARLLKTGGKIYILDPTADFWFIKILDKLIKIFEPQHVKIYSTKEFKNLMSDAGLKHLGFRIIPGRQKVQIGEKG
jgi:ubiquinone/menaquinone biosynthesis C-methylase UbiE